jgi:hypothetical protein
MSTISPSSYWNSYTNSAVLNSTGGLQLKTGGGMIAGPPSVTGLGSGTWAANTLTAISWSGGFVTATTTTAHGVQPGQQFAISGVTPSGYNGTFVAAAGTTGSTLVYALASSPGPETVLGTLVAATAATVSLYDGTSTSGQLITTFSMCGSFGSVGCGNYAFATGLFAQVNGTIPGSANVWWN